MNFYDEMIDLIRKGEVRTKDQIHQAKVRLCKKYKMNGIPSDVDILKHASLDIYDEIEPFLRLKPVRTASGVAVVAVMSSPHDCPHGRCLYCPGGTEFGTAQSYTGHEPAALRAHHNDFDPYLQTKSRLDQLSTIGHAIDKIDLIIMGGTFTARDKEYQEGFVQRCFDAMNRQDSKNLKEAHELNERGQSRCIGMTIETRPDWCKEEHIDNILKLGATRVELGVQTTYDDILEKVERGHEVSDSIEATRFVKDAGMKVCYHMMPGLPGSDFERDLESFKMIFKNPDFRPDMLKIYPTLVVEGTRLYELWKKGDYKPLTTEKTAELIAEVKKSLPEWVRIQRIQRDIPVQLIVDGVDKSNLRQIVQMKLKENDEKCNCIRCREVGIRSLKGDYPDVGTITLKRNEYKASNGKEYFLSFEDINGILIAYARLRKPTEEAHREEIRAEACMILRELKVAGEMVPIGECDEERWQHHGYGHELIKECEAIAAENGARKLLVMSGVGVKEYYRRFGYQKEGPYMMKRI